jgi:Protein of unknown function (DUF3017)
MANRPVNTGSGGAAATPPDAAPPFDSAPPPVHHDATLSAPSAPSAPAAIPPRHRATRPRPSRVPRNRVPRNRGSRNRGSRPSRDHGSRGGRDGEAIAGGGLAWLPYLIVLAGVAAGMFVIWQGSRYAGRGAALVGCSLLAGALARLILPARYAGLLASRRKASDVLAFAAFGAAVLAVAIALP